VLRLAVSAAILFFLGRYLYLSWRNAAEYEWQLRPGLLALSLVVLFVGEAALGICWHLIFAALGAKVSLRESCRALMLGQLAKYVPGKVFTLVARVHLMQQVGVRGGTTMVAQVIEGAALCVSAMVVGAACGIGAPGLFAHRSFNLLFLAIPIGLLVMHPVVLQRPVEFAARKLGRPAVELRATYGNLLAVTGCYTFSWIVFGIGLYCLAGATGASPGDVWVYVGAYALAWVAGFVVFVTPGGLGAREAALAALIGPQIGAAPAIALALLARVWVTVGEIVCAAAVSNFRIRSFLPENREHDDGATDGN
jgi:uncharacterized membrane protein YbhN (UPF0104 family)